MDQNIFECYLKYVMFHVLIPFKYFLRLLNALQLNLCLHVVHKILFVLVL